MSGNDLSPRKLTLGDGINTIISLMIGSAIFKYAAEVDADIGNAWAGLCIWLVAGLLALTGALCYAELGTMIPGSGGEAQYLAKGFGPLVTYIFDWTNILILKPGTIAVLIQSFTEYTLRLLSTFGWLPEAVDENKFLLRGIGCFGCLLVSYLAARAPKFSQRLMNVLTWSKVAALATIILGGLVYFATSSSSPLIKTFTASNTKITKTTSVFQIIVLTSTALRKGLWGFEGWNNLNLVAGDLQNPKRNLPLAIWISVTAVLGLYLSTMVGYYCVIPRDQFIDTNTAGIDFGQILSGAVFGDKWRWIGAAVMAAFVMGSTFSAALSSMVTSSEVIVLSAENGNIPAMFGRVHPRLKTAGNAYWMQGFLAILLMLIPLFFRDDDTTDVILDIYSFPVWIFYALCATVLLLLRLRAPELERPYRVFISTPILFLLACAILISSSVASNWISVAGSFGVMALGIPVYFFVVNRKVGKK